MTKPVPGPDPLPRKPELHVPPLACDSHCHVFGPTSVFPYTPDRNYTPPDAPLEMYQELMDRLGIERTVIVQPSIYGFDNTCTEDAIRRLGERARGVAVVSPDISEVELARLDAAGFRGLRFNLLHTGGSTSLDALETLAAKAKSCDWHVQIYMRGRLLAEVAPRLKALDVDIVIDHMGHLEVGQGTDQPAFDELRRFLESGRGWVKLCPYRYDVSGPPYPYAGELARALYSTVPERLVWGTDWPHPDIRGTTPEADGSMPNDGDLLDALGDWFEDAEAIERILVSNPAQLYGFR